LFTGPDTRHSWSVENALQAMKAAPSGVLVLMNCQGSAQQLFDAFALWGASPSAENRDATRAQRYDLRTYGIGVQILRDLGVCKARLLAKPRKMPSMAGFALTITGYDSEPSSHSPATSQDIQP